MEEIEHTEEQNSEQDSNEVQQLKGNMQIDGELIHCKKKVKKMVRRKTCSQLIANLGDTRYPIVKKVVKNKLGFKIIQDFHSNQWDLMWTDNAVQPEQLAKMKPHQKINHFPGMFSLSRKNYLARNLIKMSKQFGESYDFYPKTWVLPSELNELRNFMESDSHCVVIAKPEASCQGRGIFLSKSIDDFEVGQHFVVQKYMKKPFLIDGLKFDLRIYVLVAGCDPLRVYLYKEGLARFATEPYATPKKQNLNHLYMHLTNYAINKNNHNFQFNSSNTHLHQGHKRSLTSILQKLDQLGHDSKQIWKQISEIITKCLISVQPILSHHYRSCQPDNLLNNMCFEILGFDIILDNTLKPSILQVNYTPSFTTDTPLDKLIKENLINDSLVLMNLTHKIKNDTVNAKKKELLERTLTGKKIFLSKEERQIAIFKLQHKRDAFQNHHLGNFQKIFPLENQNLMMEKYANYLAYSQLCYLQITGANIKRNPKIISNNHLHSVEEHDEDEKMHPKLQPKVTKTSQLEKIYMKKSKPIIPASRKLIRHQTVGKNQFGVEIDSSLQVKPKQNNFSRPKLSMLNENKKTVETVKQINLNTTANTNRIKSAKPIAVNHYMKNYSKVYHVTFQERARKNNDC